MTSASNPLLDKIMAKAQDNPAGRKRTGPDSFKRAMQLTGVMNNAEFRRVRDLPRRELLSSEYMAHDLSASLRRKGSTFELRPAQAAMLVEAGLYGGLFAAIRVGQGKSVCAPLFPLMVDHKVALLLVPAALKVELETHLLPMLRKHFDLKPFFVLSYSELSVEYFCPACRAKRMTRDEKKRRDCAECRKGILESIGADLFICDEAHNLVGAGSARAVKFSEYFKAHPLTKLIAMSGTLLKTLKTAQVLLKLTHRGGCPLPLDYVSLRDWSQAVDAKVEGDRLDAGALLMLYDGDGACRNLSSDCSDCGGTGKLNRVVRARLGLRKRFLDTQGFIASANEEEVGASLVVRTISVPLPGKVEEALGRMRATWVTPYGEEIPDPISFWRHCREVLSGFYYRWVWPDDEPDYDWLEARRDWHKLVRDVVKCRAEGIYTELTVRNAVRHNPHLLPKSLRKPAEGFLAAWDAIKDTQDPPVKAEWLDDFMVCYVARWTLDNPEGIAWCEHRAIMEALAEIPGGPKVFAAGDKHNAALADLAAGEGALARGIVCSIAAHGTGKNLQRWNRGLVVTPPSSDRVTEQLIGRQHRPGQDADEVSFDVVVGEGEAWEAFNTALAGAKTAHDLTGAPQKLLVCTPVGWKRSF